MGSRGLSSVLGKRQTATCGGKITLREHQERDLESHICSLTCRHSQDTVSPARMAPQPLEARRPSAGWLCGVRAMPRRAAWLQGFKLWFPLREADPTGKGCPAARRHVPAAAGSLLLHICCLLAASWGRCLYGRF